MGAPGPADRDRYVLHQTGGISIYYPPSLTLKQGCQSGTIVLKKFLFMRWLDLEGFRGQVVMEE